MTLADKIRAAREAKGLTQIELADKAEIPISTYSRLERKGDDISHVHVGLICHALGISVQELLFGEWNDTAILARLLIKSRDTAYRSQTGEHVPAVPLLLVPLLREIEQSEQAARLRGDWDITAHIEAEAERVMAHPVLARLRGMGLVTVRTLQDAAELLRRMEKRGM